MKRLCAKAALELVPDHGTIGLGGGETISYLCEYIKEAGKAIEAITPSDQTKKVCKQLGITVIDINEAQDVTIAFDGCDEVDQNLNAYKSGGGIHTKEKIIAKMAQEYVLLVDETKVVEKLDCKVPIVLEIVPEAASYVTKEAKKLGADYIATGHYARMIDNKLYKAVDLNKDQTYFLAQLTNKQLENVLFPIGELTKSEVRKIAEKYDLITAKKKDSTGICFIGERHFREFLENYLPNTPGDIVNIDSNKIVGKHIGLMYYTIGQRRGLDIGGTKERLFVVGKNLDRNILYVAEGENNKYLYSTSCIIDTLNLNDELPNTCYAKFRYRSEDVKVNLERINDNEILVRYENTKSVTPGQLCALYLEDGRCIGSGIIKEVRKNDEKLWYLL